MNAIELKIDQSEYYRLEGYIEQFCYNMNVQSTYYPNILTAIGHLFDYYLRVRSGEIMVVSYNVSEGGVVFDVKLKIRESSVYKNDDVNLGMDFDELNFVLSSLSDGLKYEPKGLEVSLLFNIRGYFNTMASRRVHQLKAYYSRTTQSIRAGT
jgi:hypothetical protein